jgi:hypothetical protein
LARGPENNPIFAADLKHRVLKTHGFANCTAADLDDFVPGKDPYL